MSKDFTVEFIFKASRSGGKGGQHANKVESRQSLFFNLWESKILNEEEKQLLAERWKNKLSKEEVLQIDVEESRSQARNKKIAIERFYELLEMGLKKQKKRKKSKPNKAAIRKRLKNKKQHSEKKKNRKKVDLS